MTISPPGPPWQALLSKNDTGASISFSYSKFGHNVRYLIFFESRSTIILLTRSVLAEHVLYLLHYERGHTRLASDREGPEGP